MPSMFMKRRVRDAFGFAIPLAVAATLIGGGGFLASRVPAAAEEAAVIIPAPAVDEAAKPGTRTALLAGGCFWGVQGVFQHVKGVKNAVSGYAGGDAGSARYDVVSSGRTDHAEAVQVTYDPSEITYGELLHIFFSVAHDPTQLNRQGPDSGPQYRSAIFPVDAEQRTIAADYIQQLGKAGVFDGKIVTTTTPAAAFYPAEDYHQDFLTKNPTYPYIVINDQPKIDNLKTVFADRFRASPVLVAAARS